MQAITVNQFYHTNQLLSPPQIFHRELDIRFITKIVNLPSFFTEHSGSSTWEPGWRADFPSAGSAVDGGSFVARNFGDGRVDGIRQGRTHGAASTRPDSDNNPTSPDSDFVSYQSASVGLGHAHPRIAFWNVGGISRNHDKIFAACDNDVTCLIETFLKDGKETFLQYPPGLSAIFHPATLNAVTGRTSGGFCMLYNSQTVNVKSSEFRALSESIFYGPVTISGQRIFIVMVYRTKNSGSAVFDEIFYENLNGLLELLCDEFVVIGGDFNAKLGDMTGAFSFLDDAGRFLPETAESTETDEAGADLLSVLTCHDLFRLFDVTSNKVRNTFRNLSGIGGSLIDFVFVNDRVLPKVAGFESIFCKPCNHAQLKVSLMIDNYRLPAAVNVESKRTIRLFNLEKLLNLKHSEGILELARGDEDFTVQQGLDIILEFVDSFTEVVEVSRKPRRVEAADTKKASRDARRTERRLRRETNETTRKTLLKLWSEQVQEWRRLRDRDEAAAINKARSEFFSSIRNKNMHKAWKIARRKLPGKGGGISRPASDALSREDWEEHFATLFTRDSQTSSARIIIPISGRTNPTLDSPFSGDEVSRMLAIKRGHRALVPDGFSLDHLKVFRYDKTVCQAIANFLNLCVEQADIPEIWEHAFLHVLYKGKGPLDDGNNYCGITLKSQLLKLLESLLCSRLRKFAEANRLLPEEQIAYRPGKMGSDHLFSLTVLRDLGTTRRTPLHTAFVDLKKAFPSVGRQSLINKFSTLGVSDKMLRILGRLYSNDSFSLLLGAASTDTRFKVTNGVHEGSPLSPLLFILYVAGLVNFLRSTGAAEGGIRLPDGSKITCIMYADDILLIATSAAALQKMIDDTCNFFQQAGMTVNPSKSDVVIFSRADRVLAEQISIDNVPKEIANEAKYLGVMFERNGSWKLQKDAMLTRCRCALGRCKVICRSLGLTQPEVMVQIYDMFVSAIFRYSIGAWGPLAGDLSFLDKIFAEFVRVRFGLPHFSSINGILMQFGRRCASCDGFFLAAVQVARGLANPDTVWGRIISSLQADTRIRWVRTLMERLAEMGMTQEVFGAPHLFLERRKEYGMQFSQFCHRFHLAIPNGSTADFFRVNRPYGIFPYLSDLPSYRSKYVLVFVLSCWRWNSQNSASYPEFCPACGDYVDSKHLLFHCALTNRFRETYERAVGSQFAPESLTDAMTAWETAELCEDVLTFVESSAPSPPSRPPTVDH